MTEAQLLVLRRMADGTKYQLLGDKTRGREVRYAISYDERDDKNCRSLPPLIRAGYIEFESKPTDMTRYYPVRLTARGRFVARDW